jgi:tyrosyl-tRNA synthetase
MYGKVMSVPDAAMGDYFRLVTRWTPTEIEEIEAGMASCTLHPRDVKMQLAREIVEIYHGEQAGEPAEAAFRQVFQKREIPEDLAEITLKQGQTLVDVMQQAEFVSSLSEARRLIKQGGVRLDGVTQDDQRKVLDIPKPQVLRVGKRRFVRLLPPEK